MALPSADNAAFPCSLTIRIPFPTHRLANTALRALSVDQELSPLVQRSFSLADAAAPLPEFASAAPGATASASPAVLVTRYSATTNRMLRVAVNGFFESVGVVLACMRELDVDVVAAAWVGDGEGAVDALERVQGLEEGGTVG